MTFPEFAEGTPQEKPSIDFPVIVISRWDNKTCSHPRYKVNLEVYREIMSWNLSLAISIISCTRLIRCTLRVLGPDFALAGCVQGVADLHIDEP
jgi:hypothetical protein